MPAIAIHRTITSDDTGLVMVGDWFTIAPLAPSLESNLLAAGLRQYSGPFAALPADCFCIYSSPHDFIEGWRRREPVPLQPSNILDSYRSLLAIIPRPRLVASWRLEHLSHRQIASWVASSHPLAETFNCLDQFTLQVNRARPTPLTAAVTTLLLNECPACLEAYLDLECLAERFGTEADLDYRSRLEQRLNAADLLDQWWQAGDGDGLALLQLQSLEEEMSSLVLAHQRLRTVVSALKVQQSRYLRLIQHLFDLFGRLGCL
jgi:hypothetical protein